MSNIFNLESKLVSETVSNMDADIQDISTNNLLLLEKFFEKQNQNDMPTIDPMDTVKPPPNTFQRQQIPDMKAKVETIFERSPSPLEVQAQLNFFFN